ncbi:MAG: potassium transporter TrkA [bacterium]|nr:potassium transporter TrkA [bacterium]
MEAFGGVIAILVVLTVGLVVTRIATCALVFTGLSQDLARFQARSAFTGTGFTSHEAERIMEHPVRRRIIMLLMILGNGTVVLAITSLVPVMLPSSNEQNAKYALLFRISLLILGLVGLWLVAMSRWIDRQMFRVIGWALKRFTSLEVRDYVGLLHLSDGYTVNEMEVREGDWLVGKSLIDLRLGDEGVQVLGIRRHSGDFVGTPTGSTFIRRDDEVILYGQREHLVELDQRPAGREGDEAHAQRCQEQQQLLAEQGRQDARGIRRNQDGAADGAGDPS